MQTATELLKIIGAKKTKGIENEKAIRKRIST